jgi:hypothetical protein
MSKLNAGLAKNVWAIKSHMIRAALPPKYRSIATAGHTDLDDIHVLLDSNLPVVVSDDIAIVIIQTLLRNSVMLEVSSVQIKYLRRNVVVGDVPK